MIGHFPSPTPNPFNKGLYTAIPFTQYIKSIFQEKIAKHSEKQKTQFEDTA